MQIKQAGKSDHNWGDSNTLTFDILKIEKDESIENCLLVETKSHCFRLSGIVSDDTRLLLSVNELNKDDDNILVTAAQVVAHHVVKHPLTIGLPLTIAGAGVSATLVGFGPAGVAVGSIAAAIQSSIGNVAAGSLFATMQSLGATGTFTAMTTGGLVTAGASGAAVAITSNGDDKESEKKDETSNKESKDKDETSDEDHVETENVKESCMDDLQMFVGSKVMIKKGMQLVVGH